MSEPLVTVFVALRIDNAKGHDVPLHVTLTYVKDTTLAEREALWAECSAVVEPRLPVMFCSYGSDNSTDTMDVSLEDLAFEFALDELHKKTVRRGRSLDLSYHITLNTARKAAAAEALGRKFSASTLYMREVGDQKRVLAQTTLIGRHVSFKALDRTSLHVVPNPKRSAPARKSAPKGRRKDKPQKETAATSTSSRRARRPPQRFTPTH